MSEQGRACVKTPGGHGGRATLMNADRSIEGVVFHLTSTTGAWSPNFPNLAEARLTFHT